MSRKGRLTRNRVLNFVFVLTFTLILFTSNINFSYGLQVTVFEDDFNIVSVSDPKWFHCVRPNTYNTVTVFEGNASVNSIQGDNIEGNTHPIYHNVVGLNTANGDYNLTGWAYTNADHVMIGIDVTANKCDFVLTTMIGRRAAISGANYSYIVTGGGWVITDIPIINNWLQITQIFSYIDPTTDRIEGYLNNTLIFNTTVTKITSMAIQLHDVHGGVVGVSGATYDLVELTQNNDTAPIFPESGYIGGIPNSTELTLNARTSYIYVANVDKSIMINQTIHNIANYTNNFGGNTWLTVVLYTAPNNAAISPTNPLKAIWSETSVIENGTFNLQINFYPNIITTDSQYIAIGLSSSEDIIINASVTNQTMYTYPVYAPYSIDYLNPSTDTLGIRFLWNMIIPDTTTQNVLAPTNTFDVLNELNALAVRIGVPSLFLYSIMFIMVILGTMLIISNAKREAGDFGKLPPVILASFSFAILAFFSVTNMLPFEILIFAIVGVSGLAGLFIAKIFMGNE